MRQLSCFLEVCRDFHFSRAAKRLGMAQPPLSRQIKELESTVGTRLFDRAGKRVTLTAAGEVFLGSVFQVPSIVERAMIAARRAAVGEKHLLRIGFVGAILGEDLLRLFESYRAANPETQLALEDRTPQELVRAVESGDLDGAFLGVKPSVLPDGLSSVSWMKESLRVCLPKRHPLAARKSVRLEEIANETLVSLSSDIAPAYRDLLDAVYRTAGLETVHRQETNAVAAMLGLVVAGCGLALLPPSALRAADENLVAMPALRPAVWLTEVFVFRGDTNPLLDEFVRGIERFPDRPHATRR